MTLHRTDARGHMLRASRAGRVITVRGEPVTRSPVRHTVPHDHTLAALARELAGSGEILLLLTVSAHPRALTPTVHTYLAKGIAMSDNSTRKMTAPIEYTYTIVRDARGSAPRASIRAKEAFPSVDAARLDAVHRAAEAGGLELLLPGKVYRSRERNGEIERGALAGWTKWMLNAGTPGLVGEVYVHPVSVSPADVEAIITDDARG